MWLAKAKAEQIDITDIGWRGEGDDKAQVSNHRHMREENEVVKIIIQLCGMIFRVITFSNKEAVGVSEFINLTDRFDETKVFG